MKKQLDKPAKDPFWFRECFLMPMPLGKKAINLRELLHTLKEVDESVLYYHLVQSRLTVTQPVVEYPNDFALWVNDALGDEVMGERLASIDTFEFSKLVALRNRLVAIIEEYLHAGTIVREVFSGQEFHFMKSVSAIFPTPYIVHDLREFIEALRKISLGSLYFHIFESRLRLGRGLNDFTVWLRDSLDETELGDNIARLDPYTYTLEGLRSTLIQLLEKRIK